MPGYTSIMVQAYSLTTDKSIQDSMADLGIDNLISPAEAAPLSKHQKHLAESLLADPIGVAKWRNKQ